METEKAALSKRTEIYLQDCLSDLSACKEQLPELISAKLRIRNNIKTLMDSLQNELAICSDDERRKQLQIKIDKLKPIMKYIAIEECTDDGNNYSSVIDNLINTLETL